MSDMAFIFVVLLVTMVLFVTEWLRLDLVALLTLLVLMLAGVLTPNEALAGFSDPVVLMVAGLFVVGGALYRTGLAHLLGQALTRIGGQSETNLIAVTMVAVAALSAFMSSAGATAILIPVVVNLAWRAKVHPSKLLMPLALGSLVGGLLTLIGTPPNLVVSNELAHHGLEPFGFFAFTPIGLLVLALSVGFMLFVGRRLIPVRERGGFSSYAEEDTSLSIDDLAEAYRLPEDLFLVRVRASSPLVGLTLAAANLRGRYNVNVLEIQSWPNREKQPHPARIAMPDAILQADDLVHVQAESEAITRMASEERLGILPQEGDEGPIISQEIGMVELLLTPRSKLIGQTLQAARFRDKYGVTVLSARRYGEPLDGNIATLNLRFGDTLLVLGTWDRIHLLEEEHRNFVVVGQPREMLEAQRTPRRAFTAGIIMAAMLTLMTFSIVPPVVAVLLAAVAVVLGNCLTMEQAYDAINWQSIVLVAGMLPIATALQNTGGVEFVANVLTGSLGRLGPLVVMGGLFVLTALFSQFISNTATTVLVAPIAFYAATSLGVAPQPFLMAVAVAASTAFATPVATMSGALVMAPGGYRFSDYVKVGFVLQVLVMILSLLALPMLFPLSG